MTYVEPVKRVDGFTRNGKPTHHYEDGNGAKIPGVTTILNDGLPKPALVGWGIRSVAEYAVNNWDDLDDLPPTEQLSKLKGAPYADRDQAARRGTEVHALAEQLIHGHEVDVPPELAGHVQSYLNFLEDWDPDPVLVEATVYNLAYGWAGTLDLIADLNDGRRLLMDVKTTRSGVYGETAFQLAMYRWSTHVLTAEGDTRPMPEVDDCAVIHVRTDGYSLIPVRTDGDVLKQARYIAQVARAAKDCRGYIGQALEAVNA